LQSVIMENLEKNFYKESSVEIKAERVRETLFYNLSGRSLEEIYHWFPGDLRAEKIVLLPDLCPGKSPLPTGCCVEINPEKQNDWRRFAISDVGCGMQVLKSSLSWEEFENEIKLWDEIYYELKSNKGKLGDLGSGNHFLDAAVDENERVYFVIHTGSRDESPKAAELVSKPAMFDRTYSQIQGWARANRDAIRSILERRYGKLEFVLDKSHNFYKQGRDRVLIYKGAVELKPGEITIIPSSMEGDMVLVKGTEKMAEINFAMSHGTGRVKSRSESKKEAQFFDFDKLRKRIYIPELIKDESILTENPSCYRSLDNCLSLIKGLVEVEKRLSPVAYLGQI